MGVLPAQFFWPEVEREPPPNQIWAKKTKMRLLLWLILFILVATKSMKTRATLCCTVTALMAGVFLSQCTIKESWRNSALPPSEPIQAGDTTSLQVAPRPQISKMPVVKPVMGRLLSESTFELNGRKFLQQRIVIRENPLETELRVTQVD